MNSIADRDFNWVSFWSGLDPLAFILIAACATVVGLTYIRWGHINVYSLYDTYILGSVFLAAIVVHRGVEDLPSWERIIGTEILFTVFMFILVVFTLRRKA